MFCISWAFQRTLFSEEFCALFFAGLELRVILFKRVLNEGHGIMGCHEVLILTHADEFAHDSR